MLASASEALPTAGQQDSTMDTALVPEDDVRPPNVVSLSFYCNCMI